MKSVNKDVVIGFPAYDHRGEIDTLQEMYMSLYDPSVPVRKIHYYNGDSLVTRARNSISAAFLDMENVDYLLFIDSDIKFSRQFITRLRSHNKGIVGGVYLKKKLPYQPVCNHRLSYEEGTGLAIMREIGTGFMMIRKDVFTSIMEKYPDGFYTPYTHDRPSNNYYDFFKVGKCPDTGYYLSEDYYFCKLARECGYDVFLDEGILVDHVGKMTFPTKDTDLLRGANVLLRSYNDSAEINQEFVESVRMLNDATEKFMERRGIEKGID